MNVRKLKRQIAASIICAAVCTMLPAITYSQSTNYQLVAPSDYSYFDGGFNANPTNFVFNLSGTFTLNENFALGQATITNANLQFSGPTPPDPLLPQTSPQGVEAWLEAQTFASAVSIGTENTWTLPNPNVFQNFTISYNNVAANRLATISGGIDGSAVDGDAFEFNARAIAVAVPEPTCLPIFLLTGIALSAKRVRRTTETSSISL